MSPFARQVQVQDVEWDRGRRHAEHASRPAGAGGECHWLRRRGLHWPECHVAGLLARSDPRSNCRARGSGRTGCAPGLVRADAAHCERLLLPQQGRSRLRHDVLVGDAGHGAVVRVDGRLGDRDDRRSGRRIPRRCGREVHAADVRPGAAGGQRRARHGPGHRPHHRDDLDLRDRHRTVRAPANRPQHRAGGGPHHLRRRRDLQGSQWPGPPRCGDTDPGVDQPLRRGHGGPHLSPPPRRLRLLGLGVCGQPQ